MRAALTIARRELLEQSRNRWMLLGLVVVAASIPMGEALLLRVRGLFEQVPALAELAPELALPAGASPELLLPRMVWTLNSILFTEGMALPGILAAHAVLHDRQTGALQAVLASPIRASSYVAGKLLGVIAIPCLIMLLVAGLCQLIAGPLPELGDALGTKVPGHADWWLALALGTPLQASLFSLLGLVFSSLSRDTRTAQQWTYVVLGLIPIAPGFWFASPKLSLGTLLAASLGALAITAALVPLVARIFNRGEILARTG